MAWEAALVPGSPLFGGGAAAHLSTTTTRDLERRYACFLDFARARGQLSADGQPADTVTEVVVRAYIEHLFGRIGSVTLAGSVRKILRVATLLAPACNWEWLRRFANRLEANQIARDKRPRVVDVRRLYRLGLKLMARADAAVAMTALQQAKLYRDGLILAMLSVCELRLGVFAKLEIGRTISRGPANWGIHIPGRRGSKYRRDVEKPLPSELFNRIDQWVTVYRLRYVSDPQMMNLWISRSGPLTAGQINRIVGTRTKAAFGWAINPHLFRDCAATTINTEFSGESYLASAVLDHIDPRTTAKHYDHARMADAVKLHQRRLGLRE